MSHRSAPVPVLEQVAVAESELSRTFAVLLQDPAVQEAMVVSTCNRVEYYVRVSGFHAGLSAVIREIVERTRLDLDDLTPHLYVRYADAAVEHILSVASGLDSMVVGEQQIIGQIRNAYAVADSCNAVGPLLHDVAQRALRTGKRVHSETRIDEAGSSMVTLALSQVAEALHPEGLPEQPLSGYRALVLGAGAMSSLAATHLGKMGIDHIFVANRTLSRAENLAEHAREAGVNASAVPLADFPELLPHVDLVVTATGAINPVLTADDVIDVGPLAIADLSMPRDVEEGVGLVDGVALFDIEHLQLNTETSIAKDDEAAARDIVAAELADFLHDQRAREVTPTVRALRQRAAEVVTAELARLEMKTPDLTERQAKEVACTVKRVVDKLLHEPTVQVKKLSSQPGGADYAVALQRLFDLPLSVPTALNADLEMPADLLVAGKIGDMAGFTDSTINPAMFGQSANMAGELHERR